MSRKNVFLDKFINDLTTNYTIIDSKVVNELVDYYEDMCEADNIWDERIYDILKLLMSIPIPFDYKGDAKLKNMVESFVEMQKIVGEDKDLKYYKTYEEREKHVIQKHEEIKEYLKQGIEQSHVEIIRTLTSDEIESAVNTKKISKILIDTTPIGRGITKYLLEKQIRNKKAIILGSYKVLDDFGYRKHILYSNKVLRILTMDDIEITNYALNDVRVNKYLSFTDDSTESNNS